MTKYWKKIWLLPIGAFTALLGACSGSPACNNDACYDRKISSVDPYKKGDVAQWGSEKATARQEEEQESRANRFQFDRNRPRHD